MTTDEMIVNIVSITGMDEESAYKWLQFANMDVETAVELYLSDNASIKY